MQDFPRSRNGRPKQRRSRRLDSGGMPNFRATALVTWITDYRTGRMHAAQGMHEIITVK